MLRDMLLCCSECGNRFVWTIGEQTVGSQPTLCPMCQRLAPPSGRRRGVVKWFSRSRGYGFITSMEGQDIFVHKSGLATGEPLPRAGQLVEFAMEQNSQGIQAVEIRILELVSGHG